MQTLEQDLADVEVLCIGFSYPQDENFLFWFLLSNPIISESTAKYIRLSMELRDFLINKHKNNDWGTMIHLLFVVLRLNLKILCIYFDVLDFHFDIHK